MNKKVIRDALRMFGSVIFIILYIPHIIAFVHSEGKKMIISDLDRIKVRASFKLNTFIALIYFLHNDEFFRSLFYFRIGSVASLIIGWYRPGAKYFSISRSTTIGRGFNYFHPYSTIINAESIGENFQILHCSTIGASGNGRPKIGNNVSLGANCLIIGGVTIGDNVVVGAGSVVVKDIPSNCIAAGNPAKVIRMLDS